MAIEESRSHDYEVRPTSEKLPPQYAHFNNLDKYQGYLKTIRDSVFFEESYAAMWTGLCMQIDAKKQAPLAERLRSSVAGMGEEARKDEYQQYWAELEASSVYPRYEQIKTELEDDHYGQKVMNSWRVQGEPHNPLIKAAATINPYIDNKELLGQAFGLYGKAPNRQEDTRHIYKAFTEAGGSDELKAYLASLQLLNSSRSIVQDTLMNQIDQFRTQEMVIPDMDAKLRRILEKVEPHHAFSRAMTSRLKEHGVQLFGENAEVAHALWSSALFLRTSELPKNVTNKSVREPLIKMLVDQQYDDARGYIEELMAQYPKVLPPFVEEQLQIEPRELLKLYAQENDETSSTRLKHSESEQEQVREQAQILSDVAGKVLVSPDGKFSIKVDNGGQAIRSEGAVGSGAERFLVERISDQDGLLAHRRYNRSFFRPEDIVALIKLLDLKPQQEQ